MRRIHWMLFAAFMFAAVAVFSLWTDVQGFFAGSRGDDAAIRNQDHDRKVPTGTHTHPAEMPPAPPTETSYHVTNPTNDGVTTASGLLPLGGYRPQEARHAIYTQPGEPQPPNLVPSEVTQPRVLGGLPEPVERLPKPYVEGEPTPDEASVRPNTDFLGKPVDENGEPFDPNSEESILGEIVEQQGSVISKSRVFGGDEAAVKRYLREMQQEFRKLQQQDAAMQRETPGPRHYPASDPYELPGAANRAPLSAQDVQTLRDSARQLEYIADQLERHELFDRADQLRGMAQRLRIDARHGK